MQERIKHAWAGVKRQAGRLSREQWGRVAWYAGLVLLLAVLGTASDAYRTRAAETDALTPVESALPVRAALSQPTPEPTPEPVRWVWPLEGEVVGAYSPDAPVWSGTLSQWQIHPALDLAGMPGEAVYACRDGVVSDAYSDRLWGNVIAIDHGDGLASVYRGLNTLKLVEVGRTVAAGDVISAVAPSVPCEGDLGPHIHFELTLDGTPADFEERMKAADE